LSVRRLRATRRLPREAWYLRTGGPWDGPPLDHQLATAARRRGRRPLVVDLSDGRRLDGRQVEDLVARLAGGLRARGVRRGDAVAWQLPNWAETVLLFRACWRLGAVAAPIHHLAGTADLEHLLAQAGPRVVLAAAHLPLAGWPGAIPVRGAADGFGALLSGAPMVPPAASAASAAAPTALATILFTSGSTGVPKGVLHTQRGLAGKARSFVGVHGLRAADALLMPAPMAHVSGLLNGVLIAGSVPMTTVLMDRWDPERAAAVIPEERISFLAGVPTFPLTLMAAAAFRPEAMASLRLVSVGGAGVSPAFVASATDALGAVVKRTYGSTEAPNITTTPTRGRVDTARARETDGRPAVDVELRLAVDGELLVRGPELFVGYVDAAATRSALDRGWYRTGDLATVDADGWLTIVGRKRDVIIRGGENIAAGSVEATLEAHPSVRQAVVVGEPDERLGERVCAFVVVAPGGGFDLAACRAWFESRGQARFVTPERVVVVDALPLMPMGKPDRGALRARARLLAAHPTGS
jgi:cyclohexanecarboxylate-CoA ligase